MKKITLSIVAVALGLTTWGQTLDRSIKPKPGPAPEIKMGKTESFTLPNGLKVYVVENHKLPVIALSIQFDVRPELEGDMAGYRDMMSELLLSGTKTRSKDKLNAEIDNMGANVNVSSEGISASSLKKYQERIIDIMSDVAINTTIPQSELDAVRKKMLSGLETEKNEPDAMVRNVGASVNFGKNHPYGEVATDETIKKITLDRCNRYYQTYFRPNVAYMAIVGDVTMAEVKPLIEKYFAKWEKQNVPVTSYTIPETGETKMTKVAFAARTGAVQSVVSVTYPVDLKPGTMDVIKARVANTILGGGSQGRLFLNLREKHAWTYGSYSSLNEDIIGGSFSATVKCRNKVSDSSVEAIISEMGRMQNEKVDEATLQNAITYLSGGFAIGLEDPKRVAQYAINIERYNMPKDFYQNYLKNLSAVSADDIMNISKKYIRPDHANIVVAGSKDEVADKLARFSGDGKIDYYDYSGKSIVPSEKKAATGITADEVFKKYVAAIGGEKAIQPLKDIKTVSTGEFQGIPITVVEMKKGGMVKTEFSGTVGGNKMVFQKQIYDGKKGFTEAQGQKIDMKPEEIEDIKMTADLQSDLHPEKYGIKRTVKGIEAIDGNDAYSVEAVDAKGKKSMEFYDVKTGFLIRNIKSEEGEKGPQSSTTDMKDYKEVPGANGYKVPYTITIVEQNITVKVQSVEINKNIPDSEFK